MSLFTSVGAAEHKFTAHKDIAYYEGDDFSDVKHRLDIYVPEGADNTDVLMFTHGGAWVIGDRKEYGYVGRNFAKHGLVSVVVSYRLSPEVRHPGHIKDVAAAFAWTYKNIEKYGGNHKRIFVSGQSAGGHLTALLATNEKYLKANGLDLSAIRGAIPISGVYDFSSRRISKDHTIMQKVTRGMFTDDEEKRKDASPILQIHDGLPPMLIIVAEKDPKTLRDQAADFRKALEDAGEKPEYIFLEKWGHVSELMRIGKFNDPISEHVLNFVKSH